MRPCKLLLGVVLALIPSAAVRAQTSSELGLDGGECPALAVALDDEAPLPEPARWNVSALGDTLVQPASGDPYYLGFVAGRYYPPKDERIDPQLVAQLRSFYDDGRPTPATYAFVMFSRRITPARTSELERLGCRVLGFHPFNCIKVALEPLAIDRVAALDFVRWIGAPRTWQKVHGDLLHRLASARDGELTEVYIDVYESDLCSASTYVELGDAPTSDQLEFSAQSSAHGAAVCQSHGWQHAALERAGARIVEYVDRLHAFRAQLAPTVLESIAALDFVQFVESDPAKRPHHDESMPATLLDYARQPNTGGVHQRAVVGIIDSQILFDHPAFANRYLHTWFVAPYEPFYVPCPHGTHVAGTILGGAAAGYEAFAGAAPGLATWAGGQARTTTYFDHTCSGVSTSLHSLFASMETVLNFSPPIPPPQVVNCSWGASPSGSSWTGTEADSRTLDAEVWDYGQLYVLSAGNDGPGSGTIDSPGCAKNAFTVGATVDFHEVVSGDPGSVDGRLFYGSSRGPCGDGRWKPNVVAPGTWISSTNVAYDPGVPGSQEYVEMGGTSSAAAHVTGLVARMVDLYSFYAGRPERMAAQIMASAMTKDDALLNAPSSSATHLDAYGTGRINAAKALYTWSGDTTWTTWNATLNQGAGTYNDFTVNAGATRLVICLRYHEDAASAGASQALVNDLDLWVDSPVNGINTTLNSGEYSAQQSNVDNTEIRSIPTPPAGTWRWKVYPASTTTQSRIGVAVSVIYSDTTPDGTLTVTADHAFVRANQDVTIHASVANPAYFASDVFLDSTSSGDTLQSSTMQLMDGSTADLTSNHTGGRDVLLGSIVPGQSRDLQWVTRWATEGLKTWSVNARSDNWVDKNVSAQVTVDATPPGLVGGLSSTSHTPGVWSNNSALVVHWAAASDNLSGVDGYSFNLAPSATLPDQVKDAEETSTGTTFNATNGTWVFSIRAVDNVGNWNAVGQTLGNFLIDTTPPTAPSGLDSTTHQVGVTSCATLASVYWVAATDANSGLAGYVGAWDTSPSTNPTGTTNIAANATHLTIDIGSSSSPRYFHVRAKDVAGNLSTTQHFGPIYANASSVSTYCTGKTNSLGCVPAIGTNGVQPSKSAGNFTVTCSNVLSQKNGLLFFGFAQASTPFQGGIKCVASPTYRGPNMSSGGTSGCTGAYSQPFSTAFMNQYSLDPGDTVYAQWWMRDPAIASTTGLSDAVKFTICQ